MKSQDTKELYSAILALQTEEECKKFFTDLLTPAEIKEWTNRWKVAKMLDEKIPYETIVKATGMSSTTIARISKWVKKGAGGFRTVANRLKSA